MKGGENGIWLLILGLVWWAEAASKSDDESLIQSQKDLILQACVDVQKSLDTALHSSTCIARTMNLEMSL